MGRLVILRFLALGLLLSFVVSACGDDTVTAGGDLLPTPLPAPTLAGEIGELDDPEVDAQLVIVGLSSEQAIDIRALPGADQPSAGEVPAGTPVDALGQTFQGDDGSTWWQVRAGTVQGWIEPNLAYQGPAEIVTDEVLGSLGAETLYTSASEATDAVVQAAAAIFGSGDQTVLVSVVESSRGATTATDLLFTGDDSVAGYRLIASLNGGNEIWGVSQVTRLPLCLRGVTADGLCL